MGTKTFTPPPPQEHNPVLEGLVNAGWWVRGAAYATEALVAIVVAVAANLIAGGKIPDLLFVGLMVGTWLLVSSAATAITGGQSLGKWMGGMKVVRESGKPNSWSFSLLRDSLFRGIWFFIPLGIFFDYGWATGGKSQCLHDKMASTYVVRTDEYEGRRWWVVVSFVVLMAAWFGITAATP